jgi:Domain of unknown function (DUF4105)
MKAITYQRLRVFGWFCVCLVLFLMTGWAVSAVWFSQLSPIIRRIIVCLLVMGMLLPPLLWPFRWRGLAVPGLFFAGVVLWFVSLEPSNSRDWQKDLAVLPWSEMDGDKIVLHNIRNCDYRTEFDFTCHYYDRTFDLSKLHTLDLFLVYWGSPYIAHTMLSFGFEDGGNVCFSIETRKEKGEEYSAVKGFFRQYEKIYVMADERDVVRLRTNFRHEDVYLYRLKVKPEMIRKVFLDYLKEVNQLKDHPEWYNALTGNCTTSIRQHTTPYNPDAGLDWRLIVNGYIDELIYEKGRLSHQLPFAELKKQSYINKKAQDVDTSPEFSRHIREGLPDISW